METYHTKEEIFNANVFLAWIEGKSCSEALNTIQDTDAWEDDKIPLSIIPKELHKYLKQEENMNKEYRPYKEDELPDLVGKVVVNKQDGSTNLILSIYKEFIHVGSGGLGIKSNVLLNDYVFKDGSVCGVKEKKTYSILELDVTKKYIAEETKGYIYYDNTIKCWFSESKHSLFLTDKILHAKYKEYVPETES